MAILKFLGAALYRTTPPCFIRLCDRNIFILLFVFLVVSCASDPTDNPFEEMSPPPKKGLAFTENSVLIKIEQAEVVVRVSANIEFSAKLIDANAEWLRIIEAKDNIRLIVKPNVSEEERKSSIVIYNDEYKLSDTLNITQEVNKERSALIGIYKALNGKNWIKNKNWCSDAPLSEWEGITAYGDSDIRRINLGGDAYIEGKLPSCIGDLINLVGFYLTGTNVYGSIPKEIGKLSKMEYLDLSGNNLSGIIPEELGNCRSMKSLNMEANKLEGEIPSSLFGIETLNLLYLKNNKLSGFRLDEIPQNCRIEYIHISTNKIKTPIPDNVFKIRSLAVFEAENNEIPGTIPNSLGTSLNIASVNLGNNKLTGNLPSNISDKCVINFLDVSRNALTGNIPDSFSRLSSLITLRLYENELSGKISDAVKSNPNFSAWVINPQRNGNVLE